MRRLELKNKEKANRKKQWGVGIVLVGLMIISTLGFAFQGGNPNSQEKKVNYNGFQFVYQKGFWVTTTETFNLALKYDPSDINITEVSVNPIEEYHNKPLYVFAEDNNAELEIYRNFDPRINQIVQRIQASCIEGKECDEDLPIKTCDSNLIVISEGEEEKITQEDHCVFIRGPKETLVKQTDEFLMKVFGITQ